MKHVKPLTVAKAQEEADATEVLGIVFEFVLDLVEAKGKGVMP